MSQRAQRFFVDSREGFTFQEEREYSDKLDYEQEQADNNALDDIDTWTEWDDLFDYSDDTP